MVFLSGDVKQKHYIETSSLLRKILSNIKAPLFIVTIGDV